MDFDKFNIDTLFADIHYLWRRLHLMECSCSKTFRCERCMLLTKVNRIGMKSRIIVDTFKIPATNSSQKDWPKTILGNTNNQYMTMANKYEALKAIAELLGVPITIVPLEAAERDSDGAPQEEKAT